LFLLPRYFKFITFIRVIPKPSPMKKLLPVALIILAALAGCKKDKEDVKQLDFTLTNMTTLIKKSQGYIKQASPGVFEENESDPNYLVFNYDELGAVVGYLIIGYEFVGDKCDDIVMLGESEDLDAVDFLMSMAEDEFGAGLLYSLSYYDDGSVLQEEEFTSYDDLWLFVDDFLLTPEDVVTILAGYTFNDKIIIAGGTWLNEFFWPIVDITSGEMIKSASRKDFQEIMKRVGASGAKKPAQETE
jgi:hypothetical protein